MTHTALARKYRPRKFSELVAQSHVAAGLAGAVMKNRVAHAYLLTGPRGVGKTSAARILAMALNCERSRVGEGSGEPCGECHSCERIWAGNADLDVVEIDAASNRGVDDARELRERAMYAASGPDRYKVYIMDEAHMLTREAWNALLKILEEPPSRVVFVFATTDPQKIAGAAAPVLSRVQRFDFHRIGPGAIRSRLEEVAKLEGLAAEAEALSLIARIAQGGMRDALSILDQVVSFGDGRVTKEAVREAMGLISDELYGELLELIARRDPAGVFPFVDRIAESGADFGEFLVGTGEVLRAGLITKLGGRPEGVTDTLRQELERHLESFSEGDLVRMMRLLAEVDQNASRSTNPRLQVELLLVQWVLLDRTVQIGELLDGMAGAGGRAATPPDRTPAPPARAAAPGKTTGRAVKHLEVGDLKKEWEQVAQVVGQDKMMLREAVLRAVPLEVSGDVVTIGVQPGSIEEEGLERERATVERAISSLVGHRIQVEVRALPQQPPEEPAGKGRLNKAKDREERLRSYRAQDKALDAAADALDLEVIE